MTMTLRGCLVTQLAGRALWTSSIPLASRWCLPTARWLLALAGLFAGGCFSAIAAERPNLIYFNVDDLGVMDVGFNSDRYHTPNIDRLRAEGMCFTEAYAPAANCAPSRACCLSGQYGPRHGVYTVGNSDRGPDQHRALIPIENTPHLDSDRPTFASVLQSGGYRTLHAGKWHLSKDPTQHGFDINVGGDTSGGPSGGGYFAPFESPPMRRFNDLYPAGTHRVDIFADQAIEFMRAHRGQPFLVHMAYYSVHTRLEPVPGLVEKYRDQPVHAAYASMIEKMDQGVGKILDALDSLGVAQNTLVLFTSDNGGHRGISRQDPFRSGKGSYFEGGIREPMLVRWPGRVPAGSTCTVPVMGIDFFPTFLDAAAIEVPDGLALDGVSLLPLMTSQGGIAERALFWHFPIYLQAYRGAGDDSHDPLFRTRPGSAMRYQNWKLHEYFEDGRRELYDLNADVGERNNLASTHPDQLRKLHEMLKAWRKKTSAPIPTKRNPKFAPN